VGVSDAVMSVLKLARLDKVFPIYDSVAEFEKEDA
jgi:anti-anti-sigma regulatory factor